MNKEEFIQAIKPYAEFYNTSLGSVQSKLWFESMKNLTVEQFQDAFNYHIKHSTERWFPVPGQINEVVRRG